MRPGDLLRREPAPTPLLVSTSLARCKSSNSRLTITGLVLMLPARHWDVTRSPSLYARNESTWTAMAKRQLVLIRRRQCNTVYYRFKPAGLNWSAGHRPGSFLIFGFKRRILKGELDANFTNSRELILLYRQNF